MNRPDRPFNPLLFRLYASDLSEAVYKLSREQPMGATSDLRAYLGDENAQVRFAPFKKIVTSRGKTVEVAQEATNAEIAQALKNAGSRMTDPLPTVEAAPGNATPLPPAPTIAPVQKPAAAPGSFAASLRAMMDEARAGIAQARADGLAKVTDAVGKLTEAKVATAQVASSMARTIEDEAASVLAELGQISNMPPE